MLLACAAEAALVPVAFVLAWLFDVSLGDLLNPTGRILLSVGVGLLATLPMVLFLAILQRAAWRPLSELRELAQNLVSRLVGNSTPATVLALAIIAGVGEEMLFRGVLQPALGGWLGPWAGVLAASVLFGLAHPMSRAYVAVATLGGLYLGALAQLSGEVVSAVVAHSAYDIVALFWLKGNRASPDSSTA